MQTNQRRFRLFSLSLATLLLIAALSPVRAQTLGRTTIGSVPSAGLRADFDRGSKFVLAEAATVTQLCVYLDGLGGGTGSQDVTFTFYHGSLDQPGNRGAALASVKIPAGMRPQWITLPIAPIQLRWHPCCAPEGEIWITVHSGSNAGIARYYSDGTGNWCGHADTYSDGTETSFGTCETGNGTISAFLTLESGPFQSGSIGNGDIGSASPSAGMTANFIRASKFKVTQPNAVLTDVLAFLDGRGATSGSQAVQLLVYDNSPGHKLVAKTDVINIPAGYVPQMTFFTMPAPVRLPPGDYYFGIFTGGTAGVARNYATPVANWVGIGASFASGAPSLLDPSGPPDLGVGSVTLMISGLLEWPGGEP